MRRSWQNKEAKAIYNVNGYLPIPRFVLCQKRDAKSRVKNNMSNATSNALQRQKPYYTVVAHFPSSCPYEAKADRNNIGYVPILVHKWMREHSAPQTMWTSSSFTSHQWQPRSLACNGELFTSMLDPQGKSLFSKARSGVPLDFPYLVVNDNILGSRIKSL